MASKNEAGQQQSGDQWHSAVNAVNPMNAENAVAFSLKSSPHKAHLGVTVPRHATASLFHRLELEMEDAGG